MLHNFLYKIIPLLFVLIFISSITNAQIKIGISGGPNFASYTISNKDPHITLKHKLNFSLGAIAEYQILKDLTLRLNAGYIQRGGKNNIPVLGKNDNNFNFNYLQFAPYIKYDIIISKINVQFLGGFSFGHLISANVNNDTGSFSLKDYLRSFNITSDFGLEFEIQTNSNYSIFINGIYSYGIRNLSRTPGDLKTRDININIGFLYGLQ